MSVEVSCKKCGNRLRAGDKFAGWRVQCPQCSAMNQFPAMAEPLPDTEDIPGMSQAPGPSRGTPLQAKPFPASSPGPTGAKPVRGTYPLPAGARRCTLCNRPISANDTAEDTDGNVFHRRCYDRERARRLAAAARQQGAPNRSGTETKPSSTAGTPHRPVQAAPVWVPPTIPTKSKSSTPSAPDMPCKELLNRSEPDSPLPTTPAEEVLIDSSLLVPLPDPVDDVVPADDLWTDPSLPSLDAFGPAPIYEPPVRLSQEMYILIGIGAAMPVLAILAMLVYSFTRPTSAPPVSPSGPAPVTAPSVPAGTPVASVPAAVAPSPAVSPAAASSPPAWQVNAAFVEQLGPYVDFGVYQIRVPKGYEPIQLPAAGPPGTTLQAWAGAVRPDGSRPSMLVLLIPSSSPEEAARTALDQFHKSMLAGVKGQNSAWSESPAEPGQINGLAFMRTRWQGATPDGSGRLCGVDYSCKDGTNFIELRCQDLEAYQEQALTLGTGAILTFRKK